MSNSLKGIGASIGITKAKAFTYFKEEVNIVKKKVGNIQWELDKFNGSVATSKKQIQELAKLAAKKLGKDKAAIFEAHLLILEDPEMTNEIINMITNDKVNASYATKVTADKYIDMFKSMDDHYMKERAADIADVTDRIIRIIENIKIIDLSSINKEVIIIAHDLTPSETSQLNPKFVKGFITEIGGKTSHSAIMARTLEIPAIVGLGKKAFDIEDNVELLMDGSTGEIVIKPTKEIEKKFHEKAVKLAKLLEETKKFVKKPSVSKDGWHTEIASNIGAPADVDAVVKNGADGVGLFRSEFLYMESQNWPTEEEQYHAYKEVLERMKGKRVVIRTLDIGGDKKLPYYEFPHEMNPFLGYRAVRLQLDQPKLLETQARALLRASAFGKLAVNVPMIATIEEFKAVQAMFKKVEKQLTKEKKKFGKYELGIMVEIPSVVELADKFIKYADFFSIGTNDLIQYTFAADRMSEKVSYLYQPYHPSILRKIKKTIDASHQAGKWTAICGEMAREYLLAPVLVGMGLDEFSMSSSSVLSIRRLISLLDKKECEKLVDKVINECESEEEVKKLLTDFFKKKNLEIL